MRIITDGRLLIWLSYIPKRFRWIGTFVFLFILVTLWFFFFFLPLLFQINICKKNIKTKEKIYCLLAKKVPPIQKKKSCESIPVLLVELAKKNNIICTHIVSSETKTYDIGLQGSFRNVLKYIDKFYHLTYGLEIKKFCCNRSKKRQLEARLIIGTNKNG